MADFKQFESNSLASQEGAAQEKTKQQPLNVTAKPSTGNAIKNAFASAMSYVGKEILLPAIKRVTMDIITNGASILIMGEPSRQSNTNERRDPVSRVSYDDRYYNKSRSYNNSPIINDVVYFRTPDDALDLHFDYRQDAEIVLRAMQDRLDRPGATLSVLELADMLKNVRNMNPQNDAWGWDDIRDIPSSAEIRNGRYYLGVPRPRQLR